MTTVFAARDANNKIVTVYSVAQPGMSLKAMDDEHPDIVAFRNPSPTIDDVGRERDRRLALGFDYDFGDDRGVHRFATTEADMRGWDRVTKLKDVMLQNGDTTSAITIATATGITEVTAPEWNAILLYVGTHFEQPLWQASFALQAMNPIPRDYATNPAYWPA